MTYMSLAFLMGFLGSLHCAVMCGPIVLGLPLKKQDMWNNILQILLYQLGRITVYVLLGAIIGLLGNTLTLYAKQETLSLIIGIVLVIFVVLQLSGKYVTHVHKIQIRLMAPLSKLMGGVLKLPTWGLFAGALNGLIPCGMVYLALATALNTANIQSGALFMLLFGLGTAPLMLFISFGGIYLKRYFRFNTQKMLPWFMLFMGALFILRSANLNIPFLSPRLHSSYGTVEVCN